MVKTLEELKSYIARNVDEVDLLELLNLSAEDLVEAFSDLIAENFDKLIIDLELEQETDDRTQY